MTVLAYEEMVRLGTAGLCVLVIPTPDAGVIWMAFPTSGPGPRHPNPVVRAAFAAGALQQMRASLDLPA